MNLRKMILNAQLWFARTGAKKYNTVTSGTVQVTNGSTAVVGTGTVFTTDFVDGAEIVINGTVATIQTVTDDTNIVLNANWNEDSGTGIAPLKRDGTVSSAAKPIVPGAPLPAAPNWIPLGGIEDWNPQISRQETDIYTPSPGARVLSETLVRRTESNHQFTMQDLSELTMELLFAAGGEITADFVPLGGTGQVQGWLKCQGYNSDNEKIVVFDVWSKLGVNNPRFGDDHAKLQLQVKVLQNALNSGTLTLLGS